MTEPADDGLRVEVTIIGPPEHRRVSLFVAPDNYLVVKPSAARRIGDLLRAVADEIGDDT